MSTSGLFLHHGSWQPNNGEKHPCWSVLPGGACARASTPDGSTCMGLGTSCHTYSAVLGLGLGLGLGLAVFESYSAVFQLYSAVFESYSAVFQSYSAVFESSSAVFQSCSANVTLAVQIPSEQSACHDTTKCMQYDIMIGYDDMMLE